MAGNSQTLFGLFNTQSINATTIVVDEKYLQHLLKFPNNASDLNGVVLALYESIKSNDGDEYKWDIPPDIDTKISHNNVVIFKDAIVSEYSENGYFLNQAYEALDFEVPGRRKFFLKYVNNLYRTELGHLQKDNPSIEKIELIRLKADDILGSITRILLVKIANDTKLIEHLSREIIELSVLTIVCHAFVDCKILENPNTK